MVDGDCGGTGTNFGPTQLDHKGRIPDKFKKKSDQWSRRRCDNEKLFTDGHTDGFDVTDRINCGIIGNYK